MALSPVQFKVKDGQLYLAEGILEYCIWEDYIHKNTAIISGRTVNTLGLLPIRYFKDKKSNTPTWVGTSMVATMVNLFPTSIDTGVLLKIYPTSDEKPYTICRFEAGDRIMNMGLVQDLDNVVLFLEMILNGRLDCNIPYFKLSKAWMNNMLWNKVGLGVPATTINMIIQTICRYKDDLDIPFIQAYAKNPKLAEVDYRFTNTRSICASQSIFGALSFEDLNYMIDYSLNTTATKRNQADTPLEKIIKL